MYQYICKLVSFKVCADIKLKKNLEFQRFFTNIIPANWDFRFCNSELSWLEASSLPDNWVVKSAKSRDIMLNLNLSPAPQSQEFNKQPYIHVHQIIYPTATKVFYSECFIFLHKIAQNQRCKKILLASIIFTSWIVSLK